MADPHGEGRGDRGIRPQIQRSACPLAPPGWLCTRDAGHEGPCAAIERPVQGMKYTFSAEGITIEDHPGGKRPKLLLDWKRIDEMRARFGPK